jgi:hypothetical protein
MRVKDMLKECCWLERALPLPTAEQCLGLPPEILSEIFLMSFLYNLNDLHNIAIPWRISVLLPGQICRYWRNVALSTPRLWSAFSLNLRREYMDRELNLATIWLTRSGGAPLTIALRSLDGLPHTNPVIDVVLAHAPRWYIFHCHGPLSIIRRLQGARGNIPLLRHLSLLPTFQHGQLMPKSFDTFESAPQLRILRLDGWVSGVKINLPWAQLTELYVRFPRYSVKDCLQMLHDMPNLHACEMSLAHSGHSFPHTIVSHSNLRKFDVSLYDLAPLFERLTLPALLNLTCGCYQTWPREEFSSFLERSACALQGLVLDYWFHPGDHVYNLTQSLRHTPHLTELKLLGESGAVANSVFLREMSYGRTSPPLVPKLRVFEVTQPLRFDYDAFVAMVESRWHIKSVWSATNTAGERIQSVEVVLKGRLDPRFYILYSKAFEQLLQFRKEGLVVKFPDAYAAL